MSFYNLLFGVNPHTDIILALIGLKKCDIERFRNCGIDFNNKKIWVYTRTGGGNREDYPNILLTTNPYYLYDEDDDFDTTYATFYFRFPQDIEEDIMALKDPCKYGISGKLISWVLKTLNLERLL
jgi:beta-lactamase class A